MPEVGGGDLDLIAAPLDFLEVNYYSRGLVGASGGGVPAGAPVTDMGWEIYPQGLTDLLIRLRAEHPGLPPIVITRHHRERSCLRRPAPGWPGHDPQRVRYLQTHLDALRAALDAGVDVRGYFAWSLMDNFEWAHGYAKRFGLVYVDYPTQTRLLKDSAHWYRQFLG